jgi:hypothetical protein
MPLVELVGELFSGELRVSGVYNDDPVPTINVRTICRLVLAHEQPCDLRGEASNDLIASIDDVPKLLRCSRKLRHGHPERKKEVPFFESFLLPQKSKPVRVNLGLV